MTKTPLLILNFHPEPLTVEIIRQIEEEIGRPVKQKMVNFSINQAKYTYPQVLSVMDELDLVHLPTNVAFHLPGLPTGAVFLVIDFYARTGQFPSVLELQRDRRGNRWIFGTLRDLNVEVNATRANPKRVCTVQAANGSAASETSA